MLEELVLPFLNTSHCKIYGTRLCDHARQTILSRPIRSFSRHNIGLSSLQLQPYKVLLSLKNFYTAVSFSSFFFIFIVHFMRACVNSGFLFSDFHSVHQTWLSNNPLILSLISIKLAPAFLLCILHQSSNLQG